MRTAVMLAVTILFLTGPLQGLQTNGDPPLPPRPTEPPQALAAGPSDFPPFEEFELSNGLRVVLVSYGNQPVVSARLYLPGGVSADPVGSEGLASLTATLLTKGTSSLTAEEIASRIDGIGATLAASASRDFIEISATALERHFPATFEILADVVTDATFPEAEVELARTRSLSALQAELAQPQAIAAHRFEEIVYGAGHPYGSGATIESLGSVSRDEISAYDDRHVRPDGALLIIAGQIDRARAEAIVGAGLAGWEGTSAVRTMLPTVPEREARTIYLVDRPGSVQSVVLMGHAGISANNPDYFSVLVLNRVLGSGADSRLFRILREEKGWTYGAFSQFTLPLGRGSFSVQAEVRPEVTDSTVVEILEQLDRIRTEPIPQDEIAGARDHLAGNHPLRIETASQVAGLLAPSLLLGLPLEYLTEFPERVRSVVTGDIRIAAQDYIDPDRIAIVIVGDADVLLDRLEAIAPVQLMEVDGTPIPRADPNVARPSPVWDSSRLVAESRNYEVIIQDNTMGTVRYTLEREGADWRSVVDLTAMGSTQVTELVFSATDFTARSVSQQTTQGAVQISADVILEDGRLTGSVRLPPDVGGSRDFDRMLPPGTMLAGMDEYALAVADLEIGTRFTVPYLNLTTDELVEMEIRVTGLVDVTVPAGTFATWRTEISGADAPVVLYLRQEAPHIVIRQEFAGQPVRFDLVSISPP